MDYRGSSTHRRAPNRFSLVGDNGGGSGSCLGLSGDVHLDGVLTSWATVDQKVLSAIEISAAQVPHGGHNGHKEVAEFRCVPTGA